MCVKWACFFIKALLNLYSFLSNISIILISDVFAVGFAVSVLQRFGQNKLKIERENSNWWHIVLFFFIIEYRL